MATASELLCRPSARTVEEFIALSGDDSPLHVDVDYARRSSYDGILVHGVCPLLFLSALGVVLKPGRLAHFRRLSANFSRPIYIDDPLAISADIASINEEGDEIEFHIANRHNGLVVTTGLATLAYHSQQASPSEPIPESLSRPMLTRDRVKGEAVDFDRISRHMAKSFRFSVSQASLRHCYRMIAGAVEGFGTDYGAWIRLCDVPSLLSSALVATFVGQCIPGSYGTCINFDLSFSRPLELGRTYRFTGEVALKSSSTSSVINQVTIDDPNAPAVPVIALGKIHARVKPPKS